MPQLDIIIVNYNSSDYLLRCLRSVYDSLNGVSARVLIEDNGSNDDVDRVKEKFPQIELYKNNWNMGFAKAVNKALKNSASPYVVILNPDSYVLDDFFAPLMRHLQKNPDVGIVGPKILDHDGSIQGSARSFPTPLTALFGRSSLLTRAFPNNRFSRANIVTTRSDGRTPMSVDWVSGACMMLNRKAIDEVGLMDERFFMYWEDADWCRRMRGKQWKIVYFPLTTVVHLVGKSSDKRPIQSIVEFHKSSYRLFEKYRANSLWFVKPFAISAILFHLVYILISRQLIAIYQGYRVALDLKQAPPALVHKKEKIKVMRMIARLNIGGPAIHVHVLTNGLNTSKFETKLVAGKISPQEGDMSYLFDNETAKPIIIPELQREISFGMDLRAFQHIFNHLRKERPDIVHTHTAKAGSSARLAVLMYNLFWGGNIRTVHTFHGHVFAGYFSHYKTKMFILIERILAKITDVIISVSETQKHDLSDKYHIAPSRKINTVELGFDLETFLKSNRLQGEFRKSLGIDKDCLLIGIVGRLVPIKNHKLFFRAAKQLIDRHPELKTHFIVVGDGELRSELEYYCKKLNLERHVTFCGWVKNLPFVYADMDILALTSINEGTPVSIIEAMAASVPVIATDAGGVIDLLGEPVLDTPDNGFKICQRGVLSRNNDFRSFSKGLEWLAKSKNSRICDQIAEAKTFVADRYSHKRLIADIEKLYFDLTAVS